jgi:hypothetical protein
LKREVRLKNKQPNRIHTMDLTITLAFNTTELLLVILLSQFFSSEELRHLRGLYVPFKVNMPNTISKAGQISCLQISARSKALTSLPVQTLRSWVRMPLETWISVCIFSVFVLSCVYVAALRLADPPSKESYRLRIRLGNWKSGQDSTKSCTANNNNNNLRYPWRISNLTSVNTENFQLNLILMLLPFYIFIITCNSPFGILSLDIQLGLLIYWITVSSAFP